MTKEHLAIQYVAIQHASSRIATSSIHVTIFFKQYHFRYYSMYGHVEKLVEEIKKGADFVEGVEANLWQVWTWNGPLHPRRQEGEIQISILKFLYTLLGLPNHTCLSFKYQEMSNVHTMSFSCSWWYSIYTPTTAWGLPSRVFPLLHVIIYWWLPL